jgi:hypothetical protein
VPLQDKPAAPPTATLISQSSVFVPRTGGCDLIAPHMHGSHRIIIGQQATMLRNAGEGAITHLAGPSNCARASCLTERGMERWMDVVVAVDAADSPGLFFALASQRQRQRQRHRIAKQKPDSRERWQLNNNSNHSLLLSPSSRNLFFSLSLSLSLPIGTYLRARNARLVGRAVEAAATARRNNEPPRSGRDRARKICGC